MRRIFSLTAVGFVFSALLMPAEGSAADPREPAEDPARRLGSDPATRWIFTDSDRLTVRGDWARGGGGLDRQARNRYVWPMHLATEDPGASVELQFEGTGVAIVFHTPRTPVYGPAETRAQGSHWRDGLLKATLDDGPPVEIRHNEEPLEVVVADDLPPGRHRLVLEHVENGCTLLGFRVFDRPVGHLSAVVDGDHPGHLFDVRLSVYREGELVRTWLHRNWLCGRLAVTGLPPGEDYRVKVEALGWLPWEREGIVVRAGERAGLGRIHLQQDPATILGPVHWPAQGSQAVRIPGESLDVRSGTGSWRQANLMRRLGPSTLSRAAAVRGSTVTIPEKMPPGVYDLHLVSGNGEEAVSPRSVVVRDLHPAGDMTILAWGHTDTWGQLQAEFERGLVSIADVLAPDVVLISNSVNAAYVAGATAELEAPYVINFGNHRLPGHETWYGSQVGLLDVGPEFTVFNFGQPWDRDTSELDLLLESRGGVPGRMLNAYESDAPKALLNRHEIRLLHYAHGRSGPRDGIIEGTEAIRVGKQTASSFRIVRIENHRVASVLDPLEVQRVVAPDVPLVPEPPLRVVDESDEGLDHARKATVVNDLEIPIAGARARFILPHGEYRTDAGVIDHALASDDGKWVEVSVRVDVDARSARRVRIQPAR